MDVGMALKNFRIRQNLTQEELAQRSEVTKGFISQVERNLTSPSVATFMDLLEALGTTPEEFFSYDRNEKVHYSPEDFFETTNEDLGHKLSWIVPNAQKNMMEPVILDLEGYGASREIRPFEGEIFGYVLEGTADLFRGEEKFSLNKGDTFYFSANTGHRLENPKKTGARILWISTPPNF